MHRSRATLVLTMCLAATSLMAQDGASPPSWAPLEEVRRTERPIRDVSGGRIMRVVPEAEGRLRRLPSRALSPPRGEAELATGPDVERFHRVVFEDAGRFRVGERTISLAGLAAPDVAETCAARRGASWPCGRHALSAVRRFVRARAVECAPAVAEGGLVETTTPRVCRIGDISLNAWIVAQGWALPTEDRFGEPMRTHHEVARREARGLFRAAARD